MVPRQPARQHRCPEDGPENPGNNPGGMDSVRRIAHSLRGSAGTYGFPSLSESARLVEQSRPEEAAVHLDRLLSELIRVSSAMEPGDLPGILIVEDDQQMRNLLETILSGSDRDVVGIGSAGEALAVLEERQFALIILDLSLPDTDGRNFLMLLRERSATAGVPVIVLSGMHGPQPKTECFALGADAYFEKPLAPEVLKAAVSARLHRSVEHRREARQDALTGLPNRASFCEGFQRTMALAARKQEAVSLAAAGFRHAQAHQRSSWPRGRGCGLAPCRARFFRCLAPLGFARPLGRRRIRPAASQHQHPGRALRVGKDVHDPGLRAFPHPGRTARSLDLFRGPGFGAPGRERGKGHGGSGSLSVPGQNGRPRPDGIGSRSCAGAYAENPLGRKRTIRWRRAYRRAWERKDSK